MPQLYKNKLYSLEEFLDSVKEDERAELYEGVPFSWHLIHKTGIFSQTMYSRQFALFFPG